MARPRMEGSTRSFMNMGLNPKEDIALIKILEAMDKSCPNAIRLQMRKFIKEEQYRIDKKFHVDYSKALA